MTKYLKFGIPLYVLTLVLSSKMCTNSEANASATFRNPLEKGYFQLEGLGRDLCGLYYDKHTRLNIEITIFVKDATTGNLIKWVAPNGQANPANYTKAHLVSAGTLGLNANCIFSAVPGDKEFEVQIKVIGDCCKYYGECMSNGSRYWKRTVFEGKEYKLLYQDVNKNGYCIFSLGLRDSGKGEDNGDTPCRI
jgi:hypothetical protein